MVQKPAPLPPTTKPGAIPPSKLFGIGVQVARDGKTLRVDGVLGISGAATAKLVVGDRIIGIDGIAVSALAPEVTQAKMLGGENTTVSLTLQRNGAPVTLVVQRTTAAVKKKLSLDISDMSEVLERKISP